MTAISLTFNSLDSTQLNAQAIALKAPSGTALDLLSGVCNSGSATITLADTGATGSENNDGMMPGIGFGNTCPSALSGTYLPSDYFAGEDVFNNGGGGPASYDSAGIGNTECATIGSGLDCGTFNFSTAFGLPAAGSSLQGTWTLYIATQVSGYNPTGSLGSWTITFTTESATATTTSLSTNNNGQTSNVFTSGQCRRPDDHRHFGNVHGHGHPQPGRGDRHLLRQHLYQPWTRHGSRLGCPRQRFGPGDGQRDVSGLGGRHSQHFGGIQWELPRTQSSTTPPGGEVTELTVNHPYNPSSTTFCNGPVAINNNTEQWAGQAGIPIHRSWFWAAVFRSCRVPSRTSP